MALVSSPRSAAGKAVNRFEVEVAGGRCPSRASGGEPLLDERGELRRLVNVYVDGIDARDRDGLATALAGSETIRLVAAIAGGRANRTGRRG